MTLRRVLMVGSFDPTFGRNRQIVRLAAMAGWDVTQRSVSAWGDDKVAAARSGRVLTALRAAVAYVRLAGIVCAAAVPGRRPDAVLVPHPSQIDGVLVGALCKAFRLPVAIDYFVSLHETAVTDRGLVKPTSLVARLLERCDAWAPRLADAIIADTPQNADEFSHRTGTLRGKWHVMWVGADPQLFKERPDVTVEARSVLFYGTYIPLQGIEHIVCASLAMPRDWHVKLIGNGQLRGEIESLVAELRAPVELIDQVPEAELSKHIASATVCLGVFGSGEKTQRVIPNKVFQCMAVGRPVVTADTPAVATLGSAVERVPSADPSAIVAAVQKLIDDPMRCEALGQRARLAFIERFDDAALAPTFAKVLSSVADDAIDLPPITVMARLRQPFIERALAVARPQSILEVGAGQGATGARLSRSARYVGVEPDMASATVAAARLARVERADFRMGGIERVASDETFDMVCAFEVIEHIADDAEALRSWTNHLSPDGHLLISVPAHTKRFGASDRAVGHFRRYDAVDLERLMSGLGFEIVERWSYGAVGGHLLEAVRNIVIACRGGNVDESAAVADKTAASGRLFQPNSRTAGSVAAMVAAPMRLAQRPFSAGHFGVGWVVLARRKRGTV